MRLDVDVVRARLAAPAVFARSEQLLVRPLVLVRLEAADGQVGFGEAAPLAGYDGVSVDDVLAALEDARPAIAASEGRDRAPLLRAVRDAAVLPQAVASVDLALWDLAGRRARAPVWRLLDVPSAAPVRVNATIAVPDRSGAAAAAARARAAGFRCVKVKVGIGDDAGRVAAVRAAAGPQMAIRLDANGAWSVGEAVAMLRALEPAGIELCEEPVSGLDAAAEVASASPVPVALDESTALPGALDRRVCAAVCLKITRCGGITGLLAAAHRARAVGYEVYVASTYDGPLGIAAALHACAAVRPDRFCGLDTLALFERHGDPISTVGGVMNVPDTPGLGENLTRWYGGWSSNGPIFPVRRPTPG